MKSSNLLENESPFKTLKYKYSKYSKDIIKLGFSSEKSQGKFDDCPELKNCEPTIYASNNHNMSIIPVQNSLATNKSHHKKEHLEPRDLNTITCSGHLSERLFYPFRMDVLIGSRLGPGRIVLFYKTLYLYAKKKGCPSKCYDLGCVENILFNRDRYFILKMRKKELRFRCGKDESERMKNAFESAMMSNISYNQVIRIYFLDKTHVNITVNGDTTMEDLWWLVCEKINLVSSLRELFFIWGMSSRTEFLVSGKDKVLDFLRHWHDAYEEKYFPLSGPVTLVFRLTPFLGKYETEKLYDPKIVYLTYVDAKYSTLSRNVVVPKKMRSKFDAISREIEIKENELENMNIDCNREEFQNNERKSKGLTDESRKKRDNLKRIASIKSLYLKIILDCPNFNSVCFKCSNRSRDSHAGFWNQNEVITLAINICGVHIIRSNKLCMTFMWEYVSFLTFKDDRFIFLKGSYRKKVGKMRECVIVLESKSMPIIREHLYSMFYYLREEKKFPSSLLVQ